MIELKSFQDKAVDDLLASFRRLSGLTEASQCIFKAPTGSGKTIMVAEFLKRLADEDLASDYVFVWTSLYDLHSQSKVKLTDYLRDSRYKLMTLDDITGESLAKDSVLFVNWHSLTTTKATGEGERAWSNVFVREREDGRSIIEVLDKTRDGGKQIVLIVDEAHRNYLTDNSKRFVDEIIKPKMTIEVSATPIMTVSNDDLADGKAGYVKCKFDDVVASGLIKQKTNINQSIGEFTDIAHSADEAVLEASLTKRAELVEAYKKAGASVNPLILVQLPSDKEKMSVEDESVKTEVEKQLAEHGMTYENGKLAVWLSGNKSDNLENIADNNDKTEVLIFKEAVAVGWDCPRASILVMLRPIRSLTFEIQTVGRVLRMPEAKHYDDGLLNQAFVYTNLADININNNPDDLDFFKTKPTAHLKDGVTNIALPSVYLHRQDYGDLTASFIDVLVRELDKRFGITDGDMVDVAYEKADKELELYDQELQKPILADVVLSDIDKVRDSIGTLDMEKINAEVSTANIQREFDYLARLWSLPFAPARSFTKVKSAIYKWFDHIGYPENRWAEVQKIVACSVVNQRVLSETIKSAQLAYERIKAEEIGKKRTRTDFIFGLPKSDDFGENYEVVEVSKYPYDKCYLLTKRSEPEKYFEEMLERTESVEWWYKNGEKMDKYFAITYETTDEETSVKKLMSFYPDYIVRFSDGRIGIYDTKSGNTITDGTTYAKSDALQAYIAQYAELNLTGGILNKRSDGVYLFDKAEYTPNLDGWARFYL
ncbi:MAG: DEAD/DEAH box helicase [Candidatus Saccharimonadales bacterium]